MNRYEARWNNAKKIAQKIINLQNTGYIVLDKNNEIVQHLFIKDDLIEIRLSEHATGMLFEKNMNYDHGMFTKISEYNKYFENWKYIHPSNIKKLTI